jgi:hypothetical protein
MAFDNSGKHHMSGKRAEMFNKGFGKPGFGSNAEKPDADEKNGKEPAITIFDNGDGTGCTVSSDGTKVEHPDFESYKAHVMAHPDHKAKGGGMANEPGDWKA